MLFALAGVWVSGMDGYVIVGSVATDAVTNPLLQGSGGAVRCLDAELRPLPWMIARPVLGLAIAC